MALENPIARTEATAAAGLVKGVTACNRTACQASLVDHERWYHSGTDAFYCRHCACLINKENKQVLCVLQDDRPDTMRPQVKTPGVGILASKFPPPRKPASEAIEAARYDFRREQHNQDIAKD